MNEAIIHYMAEFHGSRDYFECHEILEEYWKAQGQSADPRGALWVALIQVAVGSYHRRRGNHAGAEKMLGSALGVLEQSHAELRKLGIDGAKLCADVRARLESRTFSDIDFAFVDEKVEAAARAECTARGYEWGRPSPSLAAEPDIVEKHLHRDRTEVEEARAAALAERRS